MSNFISLVVIQGANAVFPLIAFPLMMRILGKDVFANIVTGEAWALLVLTICLFGFDISGVKKIQDAKSDDVGSIFSLITSARLFLLTVSILISFVFINKDWFFFFFIFLCIPLGLILQSQYYFQAVGLNSIPAIIILFVRLLSILLIVIGYYLNFNEFYFSSIIGASYFFSGALCFIFIKNKIGISFNLSRLSDVLFFLRCDFFTFAGSFSVFLYRGMNVILLSTFSGNNEVVGLYALAEKYIKTLQSAVTPISNFFLPRTMRKIGVEGNRKILTILWKDTQIQVLVVFLIVIFFDFSLVIWRSFFASYFDEELLKIFLLMSASPIFGVAAFMYGFVGLNAISMEKKFAQIMLLVGVVSLFFVTVFSMNDLVYYVAMTYALSEFAVFLVSFLVVKKICEGK